MDDMAKSVDGKLEVLRHSIAETKDSVGNATTWALLLYIALAAVNRGTLARGLGWL
jgi:hypothetical protein